MNNNITPFNYGSQEVRTVMGDDGQVHMVAQDVCLCLGISNTSQALADLDDDEKGICSNDTLGGNQEMLTINQSGLFALTLKSRKPEARPFRKWVTSKVLPSIMSKGSYSLDAPLELPGIAAQMRAAKEIAELCGLEGNVAKLSAATMTKKATGHDPLLLAGVTHLVTEDQEVIFTPTELGRTMTPIMSAQKINALLSRAGLQVKVGKSWVPTDKGKQYSVLLDTAKRHKSGAMVQQVKWKSGVEALIS